MYLILFFALVPGFLCSPLKRVRRHETANEPLLLPPYHNACTDPAESSFEAAEEGVIDNMASFLEHLRESSMTLNEQILREISAIERRVNCQNIVDGMRALDMDNFVSIESSLGIYQNNITHMYTEMRTLLYQFEILRSPRLEQCCIHASRFYFRLQNRLLRKWFTFQEHSGQRIGDHHCCLRGSDVINRHITCEMMRDIVYTVLREGSATIERSSNVLQQMIQMQH